MKEFREFSLVLLLIAVAIFGALNFKACSGCNSKKSELSKESNAPIPKGVTSGNERFDNGKGLFKSNCAACHSLTADVTGPSLAGVTERWKSAGEYKGKTGEQWLRLWIKDWNEPVEAGYPYAIAMANSRIAQMNRFSFLKDADIEDILYYVDQAGSKQAKTP